MTHVQTSKKKKTTLHSPRPYLDVMTVHSRQQGPQGLTPCPQQDLIMEPIHVPDLDHTGVGYAQKAMKYPLFYPNGQKTTNFRQNIQHALMSSRTTGALPEYMALHSDSMWDSASASSPVGTSSPSPKSSYPPPKASSAKKNSKAKNASDRLSTPVKIRNRIHVPTRSTESTTKQLIHELRSNSKMISKLVSK